MQRGKRIETKNGEHGERRPFEILQFGQKHDNGIEWRNLRPDTVDKSTGLRGIVDGVRSG